MTQYQPALLASLDQLYQQVKLGEVDILQISLGRLMADHLGCLTGAELDLDRTSECLVVGATLITLKIQALFPRRRDPLEQETGEVDPAALLAELQLRQQEYQQLRRYAQLLASMRQERALIYTRNSTRHLYQQVAIETGDSERLQMSWLKMQRARTLRPLVRALPRPELYPVRVKLKEVAKACRGQGLVIFSQLLVAGAPRAEIVAAFLAVLELVRRQQVDVLQEHVYGEITIRWQGGLQWPD